jgi:hypothetical protein
MIIVFNNTLMATVNDQRAIAVLLTCMNYARQKWIAEGQPQSGVY